MVGILRELDGKTSIVSGTPDHVHLLVQLPPILALSDAMRTLKTNSSKWVHDRWPVRSKFAWQTGYGAFSVSKSNADAVYRYISDQEKHHRKKTFQEEFLEYLKKHEIEYDERYIWEYDGDSFVPPGLGCSFESIPTAYAVGYECFAPAGARVPSARYAA